MHYQENLQQNVEIIQLSVHMFEESLGKKICTYVGQSGMK